MFTDSLGRLLVIELKKGTLSRDAIPQVLDHFGSTKSQNPDRIVEGMVIANRIPPERKATLENFHIECREIPEQRFREVADEKGYAFRSEQAERTVFAAATTEPVSELGKSSAAALPPPDGWAKIVWKSDCKDTLRKGEAEFKVHREYFNPTDIIGKIFARLRDEQVHAVKDVLAAVGGSPAIIKERIKQVAHRGNCFRAWEIYQSPDGNYVRLKLTK